MINDLGLILEPSVMLRSNNEEVENALECVSSFYGSDKTCQIVHGNLVEGMINEEETFDKLLDKDKLKQEWPFLRGMISGSYKGLSTEELCKRVITLHQEILPEFSKLCRIALCIVVTSVECERSFSTQNKIKNKFRSSLKTENLNYLINIHMSSEELETYDPEKAVKLWKIKKKRRKGRLFQPYKARAMKVAKTC